MKLVPNILHTLLILTGVTMNLSARDQDSLVLLNDGTSIYQIVISRKATQAEKESATMFQDLFMEATGFKLPVSNDRKKLKQPSVLIGSTRFSSEFLNQLPLVDLGEDGFMIRSEGPHLFVYGGVEKGLLYGVQSFFEKYLGFRQYTSTVKIRPRRSEIILPFVSVTEVPPIRFRVTYYSDILEDESFADWLKADSHTRDWGMWVHTFQRLIPSGRYFSDHPEFFAENKGRRVPNSQLCLTNQHMRDTLIRNLQQEISLRPEAHYWSVSQNDNIGFCTCPVCTSYDAKHGGPSGTVLNFTNQVARAFPDKTISTLAYQYSRAAPEGLRPESNVNIMFCSIECNRSKPIAIDPASDSFRNDLEDWNKLTSNILVWDYVIQFENLVSPFPNLRILQPNIQYFANHGVSAMFQQGNREEGGEFAELRSYMIAKLLWNPWQDVDSLMQDFLDGYYGPAGMHLRSYIDVMHNALEKSGKDLWIFGGPADHRDGYLSWDMIDAYNQIFDLAEQSVQDQPVFLERVQLARLPLMYAQLENARIEAKSSRGLFDNENGTWILKPEKVDMLDDFYHRCLKSGITRLKEWNLTPAEYYEEYRKLMKMGIVMHLGYEREVGLTWPFSQKYSGDSKHALTDGVRGSVDFHHVWQGFEGVDMEAIIDLGEIRDVKKVAVRFLQDIRQWIFLPTQVVVYGSADGMQFEEIETIQTRVSTRHPEVIIEPYTIISKPKAFRYVKVRAKNMGTCPEWHMGSGGKAWIFADEIIIE